MHDLQRIESCTLWQSFSNLKESMYNDQKKTFIQHVSDAKSSSGWSACTIGTERGVLCDSLLYLQRMFQDTSYVCKPSCFSGLVHKGRQLCSLLSTSCQTWMVCMHKYQIELYWRQFQQIHRIPILSCRQQKLKSMCPAGKATYSPFHSFLQVLRYFSQKGRNSSRHALNADGSYAWFAKNWELYFVTVIFQFEGVHVQRSKEDIHTACFRCKEQLWMVCMQQ